MFLIFADGLNFTITFKTKVHERKSKEYLQVNRILVGFNTSR